LEKSIGKGSGKFRIEAKDSKFMRILAWRFSALFLIFILGCSASLVRKTPNFHLPSLNDWPVYFKNNYQSIKTIKSQARITIESPDMGMNFTVQMIFTAPDTLYIKAEGPFGIDLGKIFIGKDRFIIHNQFNNQFLAGALDDEYYNTFLETNMTFREIKNAFIGNTYIPEYLPLVDEKHGVFAAKSDNKKWRYVVDINTGLLKTWEVYLDNQIILKQEYLKYFTEKGIIIPRLVRLILPQKKEMFAIYHKNIQINDNLDKNSYFIEIGPKTKQLIIAN
jgi:hypothetical protein